VKGLRHGLAVCNRVVDYTAFRDHGIVQFFGVKGYGEVEFVLGLIKVVAGKSVFPFRRVRLSVPFQVLTISQC
jgi:hypothetical protein